MRTNWLNGVAIGLRRETLYESGALYKFARSVGPAHEGAVTHPGARAEKHIYADL